jgi:hypothetical protein
MVLHWGESERASFLVYKNRYEQFGDSISIQSTLRELPNQFRLFLNFQVTRAYCKYGKVDRSLMGNYHR